MYFDSHRLSSDRQGRLSIPSPLFRDSSIKRGGSVCVYPIGQYWVGCDLERLQIILESEFPGSPLDLETRNNRRQFMMNVKSLHIDPQGRIPFHTIDASQKGSEYMVIGTGFEFEIWPLAVWQEQFEQEGGSDE